MERIQTVDIQDPIYEETYTAGGRLSIEPLEQREPKFASQSGERARPNIEMEQSTR